MTERDTTRVDIEQEGANMFGCLPCPKCGSQYRWQTQSGRIQCDDCGHVEHANLIVVRGAE